ncbi:hypothetical protein AArcMg_2583 [Natrarchaeobaculum sulfurireducens]|uniref:Uncharacterized protein n=1 Tax=Natrarchaeobaculum sulfurireducens TaxID=2044521 RepID=A0A346PSS8_9EURY|nr:hypothetical protein AArcMg_2583 [Natrarchaeobaculum sulfurireducens]
MSATLNFIDAVRSNVAHDRIHARKPTHDLERWSVGVIEGLEQRDGHGVFEVRTPEGERIELVVTLAIRDLVIRRLDLEDGDSPIGSQVWYRTRGG